MTDFTRRSMLAAVGVALTAGCLTDSGDGPDGGGTTTTDSAGETPRTESRERKTTDSRGQTTTDSTGETTTGDWIEHASNQPNPDHSITLNNEYDSAKTVRMRVERDETGETVFETTETVDSGVEFTAWNLKKANPEGVEAFTVCAELVASTEATTGTGTTAITETQTTTNAKTRTSSTTERATTTSESRDCAPLRTNECYGNSHVTVREDGTLQIIYAIC